MESYPVFPGTTTSSDIDRGGSGCLWRFRKFGSTDNINFAGNQNTSGLRKISKNAANEDEENDSGLKSALPIKINGSYLGSNEKINHLNCLDESIKQRRRSLRETTPIKISGLQFVRDDDPGGQVDSIQAPFGPALYEGRKPAEIFGHKIRFIPTKEPSLDFIETCAQNETTPVPEKCLEHVIHNMKDRLQALKSNVSCRTLQEINREVTPFDLPDLDPLSETGSENDTPPLSLDKLMKGEREENQNISVHPRTDPQKNYSLAPDVCDESPLTLNMNVIQEKKNPFGSLSTSQRQRKRSSFKNTISYLLSKALDDDSDEDEEQSVSISSAIERSSSATSVTFQSNDETCATDVSFEDDGVSLTDGVDTDSYSWYFDLENCKENEKDLQSMDTLSEGASEETYSDRGGSRNTELSTPDIPDKIFKEEIIANPEHVKRGEAKSGNEMILDLTGFNLILQR